MTITFYKTENEPIALNKVLTNPTNISGAFRDSVDTLSPVFAVEQNPTGFNYLKAFDKYYFITKPPEIIRTGLYLVECHEDVLQTFQSGIKNLKGIVARNEFLIDAYIPDSKIPQRNFTKRASKKIGNPFSYNTDIIIQTVG